MGLLKNINSYRLSEFSYMILDFLSLILSDFFYILYLSRSCNGFLFWYLHIHNMYSNKRHLELFLFHDLQAIYSWQRGFCKRSTFLRQQKSPCLISLSGQHRDEIHYVANLCAGIIFVLKMHSNVFSSNLTLFGTAHSV